MSILPKRIDLEMTQALLRMAVIATSTLYTLITYALDEISEERMFVILGYCLGFAIVTIGLIVRIAQRPGLPAGDACLRWSLTIWQVSSPSPWAAKRCFRCTRSC